MERWPRTARIVLSGFAEPEQTLRLVPVAHQYINKPCDPEQLESIIERCLALHQILGRPALRELVGRLGPVPPAPATFAQLQRAVSSDSSSIAEVASLVARDAVVAAKLLQTVNSGFFRLPRRISNVEQAVGYLGLNTVRNLVVSAEVFAKWPARSTREVVFLETLQEHASCTAAAVVALVTERAMADEAMLAALLHDIGYWVLSHGCPDGLDEARQLAIREGLQMEEAESRVLGASHAEVGAYLLGLWGFPMSILEAVAHHHAPLRVPARGFDVLAALCIAHALTGPSERQAFPGLDVVTAEVMPEYLERVGAPFAWADAQSRLASRNIYPGT
jgi:putative nucleotidyltransferase with HDIG domain